MSLGRKTLWRACVCAQTATLSSIPRGSPCHSLRILSSTSSPDLTGRASSSDVPVVQPSQASSSPARRALIRQIARSRSPLDQGQQVLVKPALQLPNKHETASSFRKHRSSAARQQIWASRNAAQGRPMPDWLSVLDFMSKYTPQFGSIFEFKVVVGGGKASLLLSELDMNILAISQRTQCYIRLDDVDSESGNLIFLVSGFEGAVRRGLLEIVKGVGQVTAARVVDSDWKEMLHDSGRDSVADLVKLLDPGPTTIDEKSMSLQDSHGDGQILITEPRRYPYYMLTRRADDIVPPSKWTKASFEAHVASLVRGIIPRYLIGSLYRTGDHKELVLSLLVNLFSSEETRSSQSAYALSLALDFIQRMGPAFRSTARTIFDLAVQHNVAMETRTYNSFLRGAVISGDIDGFNNMVRLMIRNGCRPDSKTWLALLKIVEDVEAKQLVVLRMRQKGLVRIRSTLASVGNHMAPYSLPTKKPMAEFVRLQDESYGPAWLHVHGFNRMLDVLGKHLDFDSCKQLLDYAWTSGRVRPDTVSMNTFITHCRDLRQVLDMMQQMRQRWSIPPDEATYEILFSRAWKYRKVNMLRVIWRYACLNRRASPRVRYRMSKLLHKEDGGGRDLMLKTWETEIFGDILTALKGTLPRKLDSVDIAKWYGTQALDWQPLVPFWTKLSEAFALDNKIIARMRQGEVMTPDVRKSLTVKIPLEPRSFESRKLLPTPEVRRPV